MDDTNPADEDVMVTEAMTPAPRDEGDAAPVVEAVGLRWEVTAEPNPFHRRLLVIDESEPVLDLALDPLVVQDLIVSLTHVHAAQCTALGLPADAPRHVPAIVPATVEEEIANKAPGTAVATSEDADIAGSTSDGATQLQATGGGPLTLAWWWQHKLLAFLLLFAVVFTAVGAFTGPS